MFWGKIWYNDYVIMKRMALMFSENERTYRERLISLLSENRKLRAENLFLKDELRSIGARASLRDEAWQMALSQSNARARLFSKGSYFSFLVGSARLGALWSYYRRLVYIVRKYTFFTTTIRILAFLFTLLQSGAVIVLFTGTVALALPTTLILSYIAILITLFSAKRLRQRARELIGNRSVTVFFPPKEKSFRSGSYLSYAVREAEKAGQAVIIVSPYHLSAKGIFTSKRPYIAMREESARVMIVKKHFYFSLRKKVLDPINDRLTLIF